MLRFRDGLLAETKEYLDTQLVVDVSCRGGEVFVCTQHFMGHSLIRIDGDQARVQTYTQNWHTVRTFAGRHHDLIHGGRYLDRFEKRGSEWRVAEQLVMHDSIMEQPSTVDLSRQNSGLLGQNEVALGARKPEDPPYTFLGSLPEGGYLGIPATS
ncbi:nuclear transport factor 2 family protein [Amycolatopsis sp.]|uniref:nuclear transport factor 2 family protein n=1 Tax=Amycolatopsis sp. TaxID=37632 RepID=UPI002E095829|nr:nuclear transport factor 2 family protein [Amycolatopsis sp.]